GRLEAATRWAKGQTKLSRLNLGYFGASTGAAAALSSAARNRLMVKAVVSRGGRPDLSGEALPLVSAPSLFIVGGGDREVLSLSRRALEAMQCEQEIILVPGATHRFEEPGAMDEVSRLAADWFRLHLAGMQAPSAAPG